MAVRYAGAGYESPPFTSGWKSSVTVQTQLTRTGSAVDVQARTWGISPYEMRDRVNIVHPLDRKVYTSFEELLAHAADSFQQLLDQQHLLAQRVVLTSPAGTPRAVWL